MLKKITSVVTMILVLFITSSDSKTLYINNDFTYIRKIYNNNDIIARLEIPYLFNLFIPQSKDNEYYLNHNLSKRYDVRGNPFIDYRSNINSNQINIYGHNSYVFDLPFQKLIQYLNKDFFYKNNIIYLETETELRIYTIFVLKEVKLNNEHMLHYSEDLQVSHIDRLKEDAIYTSNITYNEKSELLIIQTCTLKEDKSYYVICALRI